MSIVELHGDAVVDVLFLGCQGVFEALPMLQDQAAFSRLRSDCFIQGRKRPFSLVVVVPRPRIRSKK